eukprot:scaffold25663_cov63-Phaeocystis_antarctica.AAC.2
MQDGRGDGALTVIALHTKCGELKAETGPAFLGARGQQRCRIRGQVCALAARAARQHEGRCCLHWLHEFEEGCQILAVGVIWHVVLGKWRALLVIGHEARGNRPSDPTATQSAVVAEFASGVIAP